MVKNKKINLVIYSIISIAIIITFFYLRVVFAKGNSIDFLWGAVFGLSAAFILNGLRKYYEEMNKESKLKNQIQ